MTELPHSTPYCWPALGAVRAPTAVPRTATTTPVPNTSADTQSAAAATVLPEERRAAREQGYAEGLRQGREEARAEQAAVLAELQASAHRFLEELRTEQGRAGELLRWLLQTLAEELSVQQLNRSPELLDRLLDEAVSDVGLPSQGLIVSIAPGLEAWWQENEFRDDVRVQIDDSLAPGMVQLRSPARVAEFNPRALVNRLLNAAPDDPVQRGTAGSNPKPMEPPSGAEDLPPGTQPVAADAVAGRGRDDSPGEPA